MPEHLPYRFDNVWLDKSDLVREEIKAFWQEHNALPEGADADARAEQVLYVVRDEDERIAGVCSVRRRLVRRLGDYFYVYRTFIAERLRREYVAKDLLHTARDFLAEYNERPGVARCLGIYLEVEAETLKYGGVTVKRAIWEDTRFVFIGRNQVGAHLRVYYFPGALIEPGGAAE